MVHLHSSARCARVRDGDGRDARVTNCTRRRRDGAIWRQKRERDALARLAAHGRVRAPRSVIGEVSKAGGGDSKAA